MGNIPRRKQMGALLVEAGILKQVNLTEALNRQKKSKKRLGEILQEMGVACEEDIALVLASQFNIRSAPPLLTQVLPREVQEFVTLQTAITRFVCPISREGTRLNLAMANPLDLETIDDISFRTELEVVPWVSTPSEILSAIRRHYLGAEEVDNHQQCKILVVEGKEIVRAAAVSVLKKEGYRLLEAADAKAGLEAALRHAPQLIITEIVMPGMDGRALFRTLQQNPATRHIPVIGFSSRASKEDEIALLNQGFVDFLPKPLHQQLLAARVGRVLDLVYRGQGFSAKNRTAAGESSLQEAIDSIHALLHASLDQQRNEPPD